MRQLIKFLYVTLVIFCINTNTFAAVTGGIEYKIPIDYSNLNQSEIETKADSIYENIITSDKCSLNENVTQCLLLYTILSQKCPENILYPLKLGKLYDIIGKDRQARGNYYRAMGIDPGRPEPYYYLGDYYFKRGQYRKALKMYLRASGLGYSEHAQTIEKLRVLGKMLGEKS